MNRWLRINRDREALAVWNDWVMAAPNAAEMCRRAMIAYADECKREAAHDHQ